MNLWSIPLIGALCLSSAGLALAEGPARIGFVDSDRIMREAAPAKRAQARLEKEFEQRDAQLQRMAKDLQAMQGEIERGVSLSENALRDKQRAYNELNRDFQREQRAFREDLNQRRNEELAAVLEEANAAVRRVAQQEDYDVILQEAVYANPKLDITEKVIKQLGD